MLLCLITNCYKLCCLEGWQSVRMGVPCPIDRGQQLAELPDISPGFSLSEIRSLSSSSHNFKHLLTQAVVWATALTAAGALGKFVHFLVEKWGSCVCVNHIPFLVLVWGLWGCKWLGLLYPFRNLLAQQWGPESYQIAQKSSLVLIPRASALA